MNELDRRVAILPDDVANQIAAGEVVERPASVVKELIENAIDAGATRIFVDLEDAGRTLIRVVDDGSGMSREDATTAILRHATSKLRTATDLEAIETLGFRGEALPSIASVSRFVLITQREGDPVGVRIDIDGGGAARVGEAGAPQGTRIEVHDLFFNVPARRKFLKSDATELAHIQQLVHAFALGQPHVHFRLQHNERVTIDHVATRHLRDRASQVLGRDVARRLYDVSAEHHGIGVSGFVSAPQTAKSHANHIYLFVNGRRIRDRNLHHALVSAYAGDLNAGRFPQAVIYLHLPPADVDVNVHPAKAEVRFAHPSLIHQVVFAAIKRTLQSRPWREEAPLPLEALNARRPDTIAEATPRYGPSLADWQRPLPSAPQTGSLPLGLQTPSRVPHGAAHHATRPIVVVPAAVAADRREPSLTEPSTDQTTAPNPQLGAWIGTLSSGHALFESPRGELLIASPDRLARDVARDAIGRAAEGGGAASRPLVMPIMLEVGPRAAKALKTRLGDLGKLGLWVESFGGSSFQILGIPTGLAGAPAKELVLALADLVERSPSIPATRILDIMSGFATPPRDTEALSRLYRTWSALPATARGGDAMRSVPLPEILSATPPGDEPPE